MAKNIPVASTISLRGKNTIGNQSHALENSIVLFNFISDGIGAFQLRKRRSGGALVIRQAQLRGDPRKGANARFHLRLRMERRPNDPALGPPSGS